MIQFYAPEIEAEGVLPEGESQHCVKVLRHKEGDLIDVIDGRGTRLSCRITEAHPKRTRVEIVGRTPVPPFWPAPITVAVAPTKHLDRMEWLVEKLTETGFDRLVPLLCRWSERKELKPERLERIALSAVKQSLKATMPEICPMTPLKRFIADSASIPQKFIAHCEADKPRRLLAREYRPGLPTAILIGPEGDFSPEEIALALEAGFVPVSLGDARLRTETAALAACHTFHTINMMQR
ncbi:MAG TPA: 16S rRNA (uracil(1498)-N(3))-methyltransferase [Porphyromonadaceae bacterium]|nr:16S rRNA (uracil(1498)-N(3))-methyltransferase [Porphyromonadaceae bacterium]